MAQLKTRLAVLASGQGRVFAALAEAVNYQDVPYEIVGLIASKPEIGALEVAKRHKIPGLVINRKDFASVEEWDARLCDQLERFQADWVLLSGYLVKLGPQVLARFTNRVLNTHPALLPKYGGKGMYGRKVHEAVLSAGDTVTGVTLHIVNEKYDEGPILAQHEVKVRTTDTPESLETRVVEAEKLFVVETLSSLFRLH
ncbi:MAG: phosphoribosylglycinamide formyltransferase [Bdellovibrionales bacterium]|nr:phosphoribosylglycinamide formyltransferase [Bdellovibrionales bacterium]